MNDVPPPPEPAWKQILCWGAVILFLTAPTMILSLRLIADFVPIPDIHEKLDQAKYIVPYFQSLTALVFGLAGLNTWDRQINGKPKPAAKSDSPPPNKEKAAP